VIVSGDRVLKVSNQDFAGLKQFAGDTVMLAGDVRGDTITVAQIEKAG
jgi:hypothetical protein